VTQERRQDERRRRRLARQQQKRQDRPQRTDYAMSGAEFGGFMGWMQRNTRWLFLGAIVVFVASLGASTFIQPSAPTPTPVPSSTASPAATGSATPSATASATPTLDPSIQRTYAAAPPMTIDLAKKYSAVMKMQNGGEVRIELLPQEAPQAVNNFVFLAKNRFYDGLTFHRVLPGFVAQAGDPLGNSRGGSGYTIPADKNTVKFDAGIIAMATSPAGVSGSQFFITLAPQPGLQNGGYPAFGRVTQGMDVIQQLTPRDPDKAGQPRGDVITSIQIIEGS